MENLQIISKQEAISLNQKWYYTGEICKNGHIDKRYVNTDICYECKRLQNSRDYSNNKERVLNTNKKSYLNCDKNKRNKTSRLWYLNNKEKALEIKNRYKSKNLYKTREQQRAYQKRMRKNPFMRLSKNLSKSIWEYLKKFNTGKLGKSYKDIVSWDLETLRKHLESKFRDGMTWENYGHYWHIDHVKPLSWFSSEDIMSAWELNNLQPLLKKENLSKNNRYEGSYKQTV